VQTEFDGKIINFDTNGKNVDMRVHYLGNSKTLHIEILVPEEQPNYIWAELHIEGK
jgi:hypothetical protein